LSDLRVTDVQAALRHFAKEGGHDIINDPYKLKVDDKQYHSLHNRLYINNAPNNSDFKYVYNLSSYIGHGETPVISHINTEGNSKGLWGRDLRLNTPRVDHDHAPNETGNHSSSWSPQPDEASNQKGGWVKDHPSGFWFPNGKGGFTGRSFGKIVHDTANPIRDTHEILARHSKGEIPERGHLVTNGDYRKREVLTPDTFRLFNLQEATDHLTDPLPPRYSPHTPNLTYVKHKDWGGLMLGTYVYDHETEEMHRHE